AGLCPQLLMHAEVPLLADETRDIAVGIVDVAEMKRVGNAGIHASRRCRLIEAGGETVRKAEVDTIRAESALLRDADSMRILALDLVCNRRVAVGKMRSVVDLETRLIRAGDIAVRAADTDVIVDGHQAVVTAPRGGGGAHMHAWRVVTVLATHRNEGAADVR